MNPSEPLSCLPAALGPAPRRAAVGVPVGGVVVGGTAPIVVQSMTNTDTADVDATVAQVAALHRAGSELVRITVDVGCVGIGHRLDDDRCRSAHHDATDRHTDGSASRGGARGGRQAGERFARIHVIAGPAGLRMAVSPLRWRSRA